MILAAQKVYGRPHGRRPREGMKAEREHLYACVAVGTAQEKTRSDSTERTARPRAQSSGECCIPSDVVLKLPGVRVGILSIKVHLINSPFGNSL